MQYKTTVSRQVNNQKAAIVGLMLLTSLGTRFVDGIVGVVSINVKSQTTRRTFFGDQPVTGQSAGTGFIINTDGIVITNRHAVPKDTTSVSLVLSDGIELDNVEVIGVDTAVAGGRHMPSTS